MKYFFKLIICALIISEIQSLCTGEDCIKSMNESLFEKYNAKYDKECLNVENEKDELCYCPLGMKENEDGGCEDEPYQIINPFVLQKYGCNQYYKFEGGQFKSCSCLPGYKQKEGVCKKDFENKCTCKENEICIKHVDETIDCVCKPGFLGESCEEDICSNNDEKVINVTQICGPQSCYKEDNAFFCNCEKDIYETNDYGLCKIKDVCSESKITCHDDSVCFNYNVVGNNNSEKIDPRCGCKIGLTPNEPKNDACVNPCSLDNNCKSIPFTKCEMVLFPVNNENTKCICLPGFWQSDLEDFCVPSKSSTKISLSLQLNKTLCPTCSENENRKKKLLYDSISLLTNENSGSHFNLQTFNTPDCLNSKDIKGCVNKWNAAYRAARKLSTKLELAKDQIEGLLREVIFKIFNFIFDGNLTSVAILNFNPLDNDTQSASFQKSFDIDFLIQSQNIDLKRSLVRKTLKKKCTFESDQKDDKDDSNSICAIENLGILNLKNFVIEEFDLCEAGNLKCPKNNKCFNRKKDPEFDFDEEKASYECRCEDGFESVQKNNFSKLVPITSHKCEDIDECKSPDLHECDLSTTTCTNTIGSYECECQKNYKKGNKTHCIELCSLCQNGECIKNGPNEDFCKCKESWIGLNCDIPNAESNIYKSPITIVLVVAVIVLILVIIFLVIYGRIYVQKKVNKKTDSLRYQLELATLSDGKNLRTSGGSDNLAFENK